MAITKKKPQRKGGKSCAVAVLTRESRRLSSSPSIDQVQTMRESSVHPYAFMIYEALVQLGLPSDGKAIADQILRIEKGLAAEDEASLLFCWLGRCKLVHKLDQLLAPPTSRTNLLVPDLLAVFGYGGKEIPVLIEVKTCTKRALSWRTDYLVRLKRYSNLVRLPLLIACKWKHSPFRWTLTDIDVFRQGPTNYKLTMEEAVIHNLMFELAGNFALIFREGITWHTQLKILSPSKPEPGTKNKYSGTAQFENNGYYTDVSGSRLEGADEKLWAFFVGETQPFTEAGGFINLRFANAKNTFQSADKVFEQILFPGSKQPQWRELLRTYGIPIDASVIREAADRRRDIVEKVLITQPRTMPSYLAKTRR